MPAGSAAKFFVNSGLVSGATDMDHLLRPLLRQTVSYRYLRSGAVIGCGTGWVERIVAERSDASTYFTPLSICINVDSFEHLEFETRDDQLIRYTLVQGDERVILEFALGARAGDGPEQQAFQFGPSNDYIQMELSALGMNGEQTAGEGSAAS